MIATIIINKTADGYKADVIDQEQTDWRELVDCATVKVIEDIELK
jgi:hypothetical protein